MAEKGKRVGERKSRRNIKEEYQKERVKDKRQRQNMRMTEQVRQKEKIEAE